MFNGAKTVLSRSTSNASGFKIDANDILLVDIGGMDAYPSGARDYKLERAWSGHFAVRAEARSPTS